jgi:phosphomannomutase
VVTASHNPPPYNGLKFLQPNGPSLRASDAERLKELWQTGDFQLVDVHGIGRISEDTTTHDAHVEAVCDITDVDAINAADFHVVVDSINGAGCEVTPMLLARLGCDLSHVNGEPTGEFAHEPEPIAKNLTQLGKLVQASGAHVGFAQDPDADRLVVLDEKGRFIGEEYTLALTAAFVLRHRKGKLAANMVTSRMIDDLAEAAGVEVVRAPTGEANVVEAMEREGCIFGGEGNGGVIDPRVVPVRDSLVGMAMILQYMAETGKPLSQLADDIPSYTMLKTKMPCPPGAAEAAAEQVRKAFGDETGVRFSDLDGLRVDLPGGWVSVRPSNTEPILRVMAEASDAKLAQDLLDRVQQIASQAAKP